MMQLGYILIAFAVVGIYADEPERLVNGRPTSIEEYPHAASMRMNNQHICGGSIISDRHILTAGHCVVPFASNPNTVRGLTIVTGTGLLNTGGEVHQVEKMFYHHGYNLGTGGRPSGSDIGIIKLTKPIKFNHRQQLIRLPSSTMAKNDAVTIVAWGSIGFRKGVHNNLQKLNARCMLASECQSYHKNTMRIDSREFCTLISPGTGTCNGDSGSGVIRNSDRTIVGLVSGGMPCALGYPDIYTTVYAYNSWIQETMAKA